MKSKLKCLSLFIAPLAIIAASGCNKTQYTVEFKGSNYTAQHEDKYDPNVEAAFVVTANAGYILPASREGIDVTVNNESYFDFTYNISIIQGLKSATIGLKMIGNVVITIVPGIDWDDVNSAQFKDFVSNNYSTDEKKPSHVSVTLNFDALESGSKDFFVSEAKKFFGIEELEGSDYEYTGYKLISGAEEAKKYMESKVLPNALLNTCYAVNSTIIDHIDTMSDFEHYYYTNISKSSCIDLISVASTNGYAYSYTYITNTEGYFSTLDTIYFYYDQSSTNPTYLCRARTEAKY